MAYLLTIANKNTMTLKDALNEPDAEEFVYDATKWDEPAPDYDALILLLGGVASTKLPSFGRLFSSSKRKL